MTLLIRFYLDCRQVDVKFVLAELSDLVKRIAWVVVAHNVRSEDSLAFTERVNVEVVDFVDDIELYK